MRGLILTGVFIGGAVIGNLVPGYVDLYEQRLHARFDQVTVDLAPFREIAERFHGGSMEALVAYHLASDDPTFHAEGIAIGQMLDGESELGDALAALDASALDRAVHLARSVDSDDAQQAWDAYRPSLALTQDALLVSVTTGATLCALIWLIVALLRVLLRRPRARNA